MKSGEQFLSTEEIDDLLVKNYEKLALKKQETVDVNESYGEYFFSLLVLIYAVSVELKNMNETVSLLFIRWSLRLNKINLLLSWVQNAFLKDSLLLAFVLCEIGSRKKLALSVSLPVLEPFENILELAQNYTQDEFLQVGLEMLRRSKGLVY